ncbi:MAG: hypothetical protein K1X64_09915 [Myxococcaceae bacterium]|nr:hypothetical protein [Myxococcaceae bacterium]
MRFLLVTALGLVLLSLASVFSQMFGMMLTRVDVVVALVVFLGLRANTSEGALGAFALGYMLDVFTGRPTGLFPFLAVLTFLLVRLAAGLVDARSRATYALFVSGATLANALLATFFNWLTSSKEDSPVAISLAGLPMQVVLTTAAAALLWPLLRRFDPANDRPEAGVLL